MSKCLRTVKKLPIKPTPIPISRHSGINALNIVPTGKKVIQLLLGGMSLFEAITTSFSVAGTGGFGIKNDSIASYSPYLQWVITIFMLLFGVNFNAYYLLLLRKWKNALKMEEVRYYFLIIAVAIGIIFCNILQMVGNAADALRQASFQVASIITTTFHSQICRIVSQ